MPLSIRQCWRRGPSRRLTWLVMTGSFTVLGVVIASRTPPPIVDDRPAVKPPAAASDLPKPAGREAP